MTSTPAIDAYLRARTRLDNLGAADSAAPLPEDIVESVEKIVGLSLPRSYARFLRDFGYVSFGSTEDYGAPPDDLERGPIPNAIWLCAKLRRDAGFAHRYFVVQSTGYGGWLAIDTDCCDASGESPIVELSVDGAAIRTVSPSFGAHFLSLVESFESGRQRIGSS